MKRLLGENASLLSVLSASGFCGVTGAFTSTLVENVVIRQQVLGTGPLAAIKDMIAVSPLRLWKSYPLIATRDATFTCCMLSANDLAVDYTAKNWSDSEISKFFTRLAVGIFGAGISHPADCIATQMQKTHKVESILTVARQLHANHGASGFFKGFAPRLGLFVTFTNIIPTVREEAGKFYDTHIDPVPASCPTPKSR